MNLTFALQHINLKSKVSVVHENLSAFAKTLTCNMELGIYKLMVIFHLCNTPARNDFFLYIEFVTWCMN